MIKYKFGLIIIVALLLSSKGSFAQISSAVPESKKGQVNFTEIAKYYKDHPLARVRRMPFNEDEAEDEKPKHRAKRGTNVHLLDMSERDMKSEETPHTASLPVSPAPTDTFLSTISPGDIIPPDTHGAVDSQYCVTAINTDIHIQTRGGANINDVNLDGFWSSVLPSGTEAFDPRVFYDQYNKRWILVTDAVNGTSMTQSTVMMAVTATNDPTGVWYLYTVAVDTTGASWMDFPNVGYNNKWITVTGNMFANTMSGISGAIVYVFDYATMRTGTGAPHSVIYQPSSFSICAAQTYDTTEPNLYAIETWNGSAGQLKLWKISGPVASPTMTSVGYPATTTLWKGDPPGGFDGNFAPQTGGNLINIGDDRITTVTYRNHKLWCSHTAFLPYASPTRSSIMWWQLDTLANPLQNGLIDDATSTVFYAYSSIAVNANDDALIGMGIFSGTTYPSGGYALHLGTDATNSIHPAVTYVHGQANYYETFGAGRNRWGDYSATCIDPRNDTDFWTIQESSYVGTAPNWYTWWAGVQFCPKPAPPVVSSSPGTLCVGASGEYILDSIPGATTYEWIVSGTGWSSGSSVTDSINLLAGTGVATVTVLAYNACGEGEPLTLNLTPGTAPGSKPMINALTHACLDSPIAVFSATDPSAYPAINSYNWQTIGTGWSGSGDSSAFIDSIGIAPDTIICSVANSCGISPTDTFIVTPAIVPSGTFSIENHVTEININDVISFSGTAPAGSTYLWNYGASYGSVTPGGAGPGPQTVNWPTPGLETLTLSVVNAGCSSVLYTDTVLVIDSTTGIRQLSQINMGINIIPNPNNGSFEILFDKSINNSFVVKLADMQGRFVYNNRFSGTNNNKIAIATDNLPSGVYTVSLFIDGALTTKEITITK